MQFLAYVLNLEWEHLGYLLGGMGLLGTALGVIVFKFWSKYNKLVADASSRANALKEEDDNLREKLLLKYKEMFELEKQRGESEIASLRQKVNDLTDEQGHLKERVSELLDENEKLRKLNVQYQEDKQRDTAKIAELKERIEKLTEQVEEMERRSR